MSNTKQDFLYSIVDSQGRSMYVRFDGAVDRTPTPRWLANTPDGWQELSFSFGRSEENPGLYRAFTVPIKAVIDGGKILKYLAATEGIKAFYYLVVHKLNRATDQYLDFLVGRIDMTAFIGDPYGATITVLESGPVELMKNKGNTVYEIPLDVSQAVTVVNDGITLRGAASYFAFNGDSIDLLRNHTVALNVVQNETGTQYSARNAERVVLPGTSGADVAATGQHSFTSTVNTEVPYVFNNLQLRVSWTGGVGVLPSPGIGLQSALRVQLGDTILSTTVLLNVSGVNNVYGPVITSGKTHTINGTYNITVPENARVYFITIVTVIGATGDALTKFDYLLADEPQISVTFNSRFPATRQKVLRPEYVWNELIKKISDGKYTGQSLPLQTVFRNTTLTSGDGIRALEGAVIKTSLNDFIKSYYGQHALSPRIDNNVAVLDYYVNFFRNDQNIIDLTVFGEVSDLEWRFVPEKIHSDILVGQADQNYDDLNGKQEINTTFRFETVITEQENPLDLLTPYRKDCFGMEFLRQNLAGKKTTDSLGDNDTFMVDIADTTFTGNISMSGIGNTITTIGRFQSVFVGSKVTLSGTPSNDGVYDVVSVLKDDLFTEITVQQALNTENAFGATLESNEAALNRPLFDSMTGVISTDIYNVMLSPKRSLLSHGRYIHSGLDLQDNSYIKFVSADKNDQLSTTENGITITEKANVFVGSLPAPLFRPIKFTFNTRVPLNLMDILLLPPEARYGRVKFRWKGNDYYGFILKASQVPQLNPSQNWELICAAGVNILPLVNS